MKIIRICGALGLFAINICAFAKDYDLVKDGKATSCIVLPDNAGATEKHAASELSLFLEKVSGAKVAVQDAPSKDFYNIYLGTSDAKNMPRSIVIDKAVSQLKEDGFVLAADKDGVRVIGKKSVGVLFGTYEILKKYAGMRWFAPGVDFEYCPKKPVIAVPDQVTVSNPSFEVRRLALVCADWRSPIVDTWDWMVRNGIPVLFPKAYYFHTSCSPLLRTEVEKHGAEIVRDAKGVMFADLLSDSLFTMHPEYFALIDGKRTPQHIESDPPEIVRQPCTSNPKVAEIMAESLNKLMDMPPRGGNYLIGNNDSEIWCQCANCVKLDPPDEKEKHSLSTRYYTFINKIVCEVYKTHPDAKLWAWGYQNFRYPPTGVVPDPRLFIEFCPHGRCYRHSMADLTCQANDKFRDMLGQWGKLPNPVSTLEYLDGTDFVLYVPIEKSFAEDIKYYKKTGLTGCSLFTAPPDGKFAPIFQDPRYRECMLTLWQTYYIAAQLLWDVDADYDRIYEDMGSKYYGKTWPVMKEYRVLLTKSFMETTGHINYGTQQNVLGKCLEKPGLEAELIELLDTAEKMAGNDQTAIQRVNRDREYFYTYWPTTRHQELLLKLQKKLDVNKSVDKIVIDGNLDEANWKKADATTGFIISHPYTVDKTLADPQTFVKMLYDDENVYFAIEAMEPESGKMKMNINERDGAVYDDSSLELFIAAPATNRKYAQIVINPKGVVYDSMTDPGVPADLKFDSNVEVKASVLAYRWIVEIRIPSAALGCKIQDGEMWKINVARNRILVDGTKQYSSLCNGTFGNPDEFRPVAFGQVPLIRNGDFEDIVQVSNLPRNAVACDAGPMSLYWTFADDQAPTQWTFIQTGTLKVVEADAASGKRFIRVKGSLENKETGQWKACYPWIGQRINLPVDYHGNIKIRAKVRGKGTLHIGVLQTSSVQELKEIVLSDSKAWVPVEVVYTRDNELDIKVMFGFYPGQIDLDDVSVTIEDAAVPMK